MAEHLFLPVPTGEMTRLASDIADARVAADKPRPKILRNHFARGAGKGLSRRLTGGCLRDVGTSDRLFLLLHGTGRAGAARVGANRNHGREGAEAAYKTYTPEALAQSLAAEGLRNSFRKLHLLCCGGGLTGKRAVHGANARSFAGRVFDAMIKGGYAHVSVTGYLGDVLAGAGGGIKVDRSLPSAPSAKQLVGDDWRITYCR